MRYNLYMDKTKIRYVFAELLMLLACGVAAGVAFAVQMIARKFESEDVSFMFYGCTYTYNPVAYIAGWLIYGGCLAAVFKFFASHVDAPENPGIGFRILAVFAALFIVVCVFVSIILESFMFLGMTGYMRPEFLLYLSAIGMPAVSLAVMVYFIFRRKAHE